MTTTNQDANVRTRPSPLHSVESDLLSREQAAAYLGVAVQTLAIWKSARRYDLPFVKVGRLVRYKRSELETFISRHSSSNVPVTRA